MLSERLKENVPTSIVLLVSTETLGGEIRRSLRDFLRARSVCPRLRVSCTELSRGCRLLLRWVCLGLRGWRSVLLLHTHRGLCGRHRLGIITGLQTVSCAPFLLYNFALCCQVRSAGQKLPAGPLELLQVLLQGLQLLQFRFSEG